MANVGLTHIFIAIVGVGPAQAKPIQSSVPECIKSYRMLVETEWPEPRPGEVRKFVSVHSSGLSTRQTAYLFTDVDLPLSDRKRVVGIVRSVNAFLGDRFRLPDHVLIDSDGTAEEAYALKLNRICEIKAPRQLCTRDHVLVSAKASEPIVEHEYGHAIYTTEMIRLAKTGKISGAYLSLTNFNQKRGEVIFLINEVELLKRKIGIEKSQAKIEILNKKLDEANRRIHAIGAQFNSLSAEVKFPTSLHVEYEELFSDLLSILKRNDPAAIVNALGQGSDSLRNPSVNRGADLDWQYFAKPEDPHVTLGPTMTHIWKTYLQRNLSRNERANLLHRIFVAIAKETDTRMNDPSLHEISPQLRNQRLIRAIESSVAEEI